MVSTTVSTPFAEAGTIVLWDFPLELDGEEDDGGIGGFLFSSFQENGEEDGDDNSVIAISRCFRTTMAISGSRDVFAMVLLLLLLLLLVVVVFPRARVNSLLKLKC